MEIPFSILRGPNARVEQVDTSRLDQLLQRTKDIAARIGTQAPNTNSDNLNVTQDNLKDKRVELARLESLYQANQSVLDSARLRSSLQNRGRGITANAAAKRALEQDSQLISKQLELGAYIEALNGNIEVQKILAAESAEAATLSSSINSTPISFSDFDLDGGSTGLDSIYDVVGVEQPPALSEDGQLIKDTIDLNADTLSNGNNILDFLSGLLDGPFSNNSASDPQARVRKAAEDNQALVQERRNLDQVDRQFNQFT